MYTLMIVDNNPVDREFLHNVISKNFKNIIYKIIEAKDGIDSVEKAKQYMPDIIIMNIDLPQINGLKAQQKIISFLPNVSTIILSKHSNFDYVQEALRCKAKDYLLKPVQYSSLQSSIKKILSELNEPLINNSYINTRKPQSDIIKETIAYLNDNFQNKIDLHHISKEIHINYHYLSRLFKKELGISYVDYLNTLRINKACSLLTSTSYPSYRIATDSGFADSAYFSRVFTKHTNLTPRQYRKQYLCINS